MSTFICEKCGKIDNSACGNNFHTARRNKYYLEKYGEFELVYKPQFSYFETHCCCSDCCVDVEYSDSSGKLGESFMSSFNIENKTHWSEYGKEACLQAETRKDGSLVNATEYFESHRI